MAAAAAAIVELHPFAGLADCRLVPQRLETAMRSFTIASSLSAMPGAVEASCLPSNAVVDDHSCTRSCPTPVFYGSTGQMANLFDIPAEWRKRFDDPKDASLPGGHFCVDQFPDAVALTLRQFLSSAAR